MAAGVAGLTGGVGVGPLRAASVRGANDRINLGLIGCGEQGRADLLACLRLGGFDRDAVACRSIADPDDDQSARVMRALDDLGHKRERQRHKEYARVLEDRDIDAVLIATPDHWHALMILDALDAGKDVYLATPVTATVGEINPVVGAARKANRFVQVGLENRSVAALTKLRERLSSGALGNITGIRAWSFVPGAGALRPQPVDLPPAYCDYEMWLGPAPKHDFTMNRFHGRHHWFWDYGGGHLSRTGLVWLDLAAQLLDLGMPDATVSLGGKRSFPGDDRETPDTQAALWSFDRLELSWRHGLGVRATDSGFAEGIVFEGSEGSLLIHQSGWQWRQGTDRTETGTLPGVGARQADHLKNFLASVRGRQRPPADLTGAHASTVWCHLANVAQRSGQRVIWDKGVAAPSGTPEIDRYLHPRYRVPWKLPS